MWIFISFKTFLLWIFFAKIDNVFKTAPRELFQFAKFVYRNQNQYPEEKNYHIHNFVSICNNTISKPRYNSIIYFPKDTFIPNSVHQLIISNIIGINIFFIFSSNHFTHLSHFWKPVSQGRLHRVKTSPAAHYSLSVSTQRMLSNKRNEKWQWDSTEKKKSYDVRLASIFHNRCLGVAFIDSTGYLKG